MQVSVLVKLLSIMSVNTSPETAITARDIALKWDSRYPDGEPDESTLRQIQRYMNELTASIEDLPPLIEYEELAASSQPGSQGRNAREIRHFYLPPDRIVKWFMTEQAAVSLLLTGQLVGQSLGGLKQLGFNRVKRIANDVIDLKKSDELRRIARSIRIVQDGIGRLRATIRPGVLQTMLDAIISDRAVAFTYVKSSGESKKQTINPLGLISKDGTIYLIGTKGHDTKPIHYALQRVEEADVASRSPRIVPAEFDLDDYIERTHQLSHPTGGDIRLVLEVRDEALYHFTERPLSWSQKIEKTRRKNWYKVVAEIPNTVLLMPFLMSMLHKVRVLEPAHLRHDVAQMIEQMRANYQT